MNKTILLMTLIFSFSLKAFANKEFFVDKTFNTKVHIGQLGLENSKSILLVHGLGTNAAKDWDPIKLELSKKFHLILIDLPGFGLSQKSPKPYTLENYAKLLSEILKKYSKNEKTTVIGHSLGGATTLKFAHSYSQLIDKVVLIDAAGILHRSVFVKHMSRLEKDSEASYPFKGIVDKIKGVANTISEVVIETTDKYASLQKILLATPSIRAKLVKDKSILRAAISLIEEDFTDATRFLELPVLILWGEKDKVAPLRVGKLLDYHLKNSKLHIFNGIGHNPMAKVPKKVSSQIINWLENPITDEKVILSKGDKIVECKNKNNQSLQGSYKKVTLKGCNNFNIKKSHIQKLVLRNSSVNLENVTIQGSEIGIDLEESVLDATNLLIEAETALKINDSKMDLAGVEINASKKAIEHTGSSFIYWSVSRLKQARSTQKVLHQRKNYK